MEKFVLAPLLYLLAIIFLLTACTQPARHDRFIAATAAGKTETVREMLAAGEIEINSPAEGGPAISIATYYGHVDVVMLLIEYKADVNARDEYGVTPLMTAAMRGQTEIARLLLKSGADPSVTVLVEGGTRSLSAVEIAKMKDHPEVASLIEEFQETPK